MSLTAEFRKRHTRVFFKEVELEKQINLSRMKAPMLIQ